jgi:hypothetical protein
MPLQHLKILSLHYFAVFVPETIPGKHTAKNCECKGYYAAGMKIKNTEHLGNIIEMLGNNPTKMKGTLDRLNR